MMQILAAWSGCRESAELCNLVDTGKRVDAYTSVYHYMLERNIAPQGLERKDTKRAIMTSFYASEKEPRLVFGDEYLNYFFETMLTLAPGAWTLNELFKAIWDNQRDFYSWVLPDNFHASFKVKDKVEEDFVFFGEQHTMEYKVQRPIEKGRALGANITHSGDGMIDRELTARCNYDPMAMIALDGLLAGGKELIKARKDKDKTHKATELWKNYELSGFLSARILKYIDSTTIDIVDPEVIKHLRSTMPSKPFQILSVFDCFNVLPHYCNDLRLQYNTILSEYSKSNMLNFILSQIMGENVNIQKRDPELYKDILISNYAIS